MQYLLIGIGGAIGATLRYIISIFVIIEEPNVFPIATLSINLFGCFLLGLLSSGLEWKLKFQPMYIIAIKTGLIGSFTTFSTFSVEIIQLLHHHNYLYALLYIFASAFLGLMFAYFGMQFGKQLAERKIG